MRHTFHWTKLAVIFALTVGSLQIGQASDSISTPFALTLSSASTQDLLGGLKRFTSPSGAFQTVLPDQNISTPYATTISGIHLSLSYAFDEPAPGANLSEWNLQSKSISADIVVDTINANQTIVEQSGGTTLTLQVNAVCTNVHLQLAPGSTQMAAIVDLALTGGHPAFTIKQFSASWTPSAWQVVSLNCTGPTGFSQLVQQNIATELQNINPFLPAIEKQIQSQLATVSSTTLSWVLNTSDYSGISLALDPQNLQFLADGGINLTGVANFNFSRLQNTKCQALVAGVLPEISTSATDSLMIPVDAVPALITCMYLNGSVAYNWTSQNFPAFQSLLGNWFLKLFVWPDLERFNRQSIFSFGVYPEGEPEIDNITVDQSNNFNFQVSAPLLLATYAPEADGLEHYVDLSTGLSGPASISLHGGVISFKQTTKKMKIAPTWDVLFVQNHHPDTRIWTSVIAGYLKSYLSKTGFAYTLPTFTAPNAFTMNIGDATSDGSNVSISLNIKKLLAPTQ